MRRGEADFWIASDALDYNAIWASCRWKTVNIRFFLNRYFPFRDRARTDLIKSDDQHYDVCSIGSGVRYQIFRDRKISDSSFYFVPNFNFQFCHMLRILNVETKYFISRKECDFPLSMWTYILTFWYSEKIPSSDFVISWYRDPFLAAWIQRISGSRPLLALRQCQQEPRPARPQSTRPHGPPLSRATSVSRDPTILNPDLRSLLTNPDKDTW